MGKRPDTLKPPAYLAKNPPVPKPAPARQDGNPAERDATRYGDWELKGIAIDF